MAMRIDIPKEELERLYWKEGLTQKRIANKFHIGEATLCCILKRKNIKTKPMYLYSKVIGIENEIISLYRKGNSTNEIADIFNLSNGTVRKVLINHNIERRHPIVGIQMRRDKNSFFNKIKKSDLHYYYVIKKMSMLEVGNKLGISESCAYKLLKKHGISRNHSEASKLVFEKYPYMRKVMSKNVKRNFKKIMKSIRHKPNKIEFAVQQFLEMNYPGEWKYCGDGSVIMNGFCPDFINCNGQKRVILVNGIYWHLWRKGKDWTKSKVEKLESVPYNKLGFDVIFLWEDELVPELVFKRIG